MLRFPYRCPSSRSKLLRLRLQFMAIELQGRASFNSSERMTKTMNNDNFTERENHSRVAR